MSQGLEGVKLHLVESLDDAYACANWAIHGFNGGPGPDGAMGLDTESTGFKWHGKDYARTVQVGDGQHGWMIPVNTWWGLFLDIMKHHRGPIDMMNAKFDYAFLRKAGIELEKSRIRDVGVMSHILEPHMSRALKTQAARFIDPAATALQHLLDDAIGGKSGWTWETIPIDFEPYWSYGALDPVLTYKLSEHHLPLVQEQAPKALELETAYQWVALQMETNGVHVDVDYAEEHFSKFTGYCVEVERWCKKTYGISPGSNQSVIKKLQEAGYDFDKTTASGALALDKDVLESIEHPLAQAVLQRRQLQKMASTYLSHYIENADGDSLIHPTINTLGTRTSRCSMQDPNFQNLPVRGGNPGIKVIRNCVTARPGRTLVFCDLDQIEMRGLAILSKDRGLLDAFRQPEDFFVTVARNIFGDPYLVKSDPRRQPTKNSMYAKIYGAGLAKQALTAGVTIDQMKFVNDNLNAAYPGIEEFASFTFNEGMINGYATCPFTGRRHYADRGKEYTLVNYKIQGWAAALFKHKQLELNAAGLGDWMILAVHDEIILDVPNEDLDDAVHTIQSIMNDYDMFEIGITSGVSYGQRWGEKKEWVWEDR